MNERVSDRDIVLTGPETLGGKYMRRFWQPVMRSVDILPGQARPVRIMSEDFTLYRGESGTAQAVGHRCAHRGTQLAAGSVEGERIRCLYHGWKYDADGTCVERPGSELPKNAKLIPSYPVREYLGLVFVYFGEGTAPPFPRYPKMECDGVRDVTVDVFPCNFQFCLENDSFHLAFTHRNLMEARGLTGFPEVWGEESAWGITCYERWPGKDTVGVTFRGMPNIGHNVPTAIVAAKGIRHALHIHWRVPIDDNSHAQLRVLVTTVTGKDAEELLASRPPDFYDRSDIPRLGDAVLAGKLQLSDIKHTHIEYIQDYVAQVGQGPIETRDDEMLAKTDSIVVLQRRIWKRELEALASGRPLKHWAYSEEITQPVSMI